MKKRIETLDEFIKESLNEYTKDKLAGDTYIENIKIDGFDDSTIKADKDSAKFAEALAAFWEKGKAIDKNSWNIKDEDLYNLTNKNKTDYEFTVIQITKPTKDLKVGVEFRDKDIHGKSANFVYIRISRMG